MYLCMYVCMRVCIYVTMYVCTRVCVYGEWNVCMYCLYIDIIMQYACIIIMYNMFFILVT